MEKDGNGHRRGILFRRLSERYRVAVRHCAVSTGLGSSVGGVTAWKSHPSFNSLVEDHNGRIHKSDSRFMKISKAS